MTIAVRYYTRGGNTKRLAQAVAEAVGVEAKDLSAPLLEKVDLLFLCSSVYAFAVAKPVQDYLEDNNIHIGKLVNLSTSGTAKGNYRMIAKIAEQNDIELCREEFHCPGAFAMLHKGRPNEEDLAAAAAFARQVAGM